MCPPRVTNTPSSRNSKLLGSSCAPGSERKCRMAPRCADGWAVRSVRSTTVDPSQHFGSLFLGYARNVAQGHGAGGNLLAHLLGVGKDAFGCVEQQAVGSRSEARLG